MDKNSFILYTDYYEMIEMLTIEQRGILLTACMLYQMGKDLPEMDLPTKIVFTSVSGDIRRNNAKYERIVERRREAGRKGGYQKWENLAKLANARDASENLANDSKAKQSLANLADNDNENVNDNDTDNENDNDNGNDKDNVNDTLSPPNPLKGAESGSSLTPSLSEIQAYCIERNSSADPEEFYDFYTSKGWLIGKTPMKDWKAAFRGWERNHKAKAQPDRYADIDDWYRRRTAEDDQRGIFDNQPSDQSSVY